MGNGRSDTLLADQEGVQLGIVLFKGSRQRKHTMQDNGETINVDLEIVVLREKDFGRHCNNRERWASTICESSCFMMETIGSSKKASN